MPAVVGATVLTFVEAGNLAAADIDIATVFFGIAVTVIVGYFFLKLLRRIVLRGRFQLFAFYCWAIGLIVLLTQVLGTL
jgi:undecaprenyl-diphosphatase